MMTLGTLFFGWALKGSLLLACAIAVALGLRRPAARHHVLSLAMLGLLALPLASALLPRWDLHLLPAGTPELDVMLGSAPLAAPPTSPAVVSAQAAPQQNSGSSARSLHQAAILREGFLFLYVFGFFVALARLVGASLASRRLLHEARPLADASWQQLLDETRQTLEVQQPVRLYRSAHSLVPLTFGILRPCVLLPAEADSWSLSRRKLVLLHELAHVRRRDCLVQLMAQLGGALHFYNPLFYIAQRLLRQDQELAADALVLQAGALPSAYAGELLHVARGLQVPLASAVAMAGQTRLEGRLRQILDPRADHRPPGRAFKLVTVALALLVGLPLFALNSSLATPSPSPQAQRVVEALREKIETQLKSELGRKPARLELTLDPLAQTLIEEELSAIVQQFQPTSASIVALDPQSGAILGLGNRGGGGRNLALEEAYEPASTLKVFTVAAALDNGTIRADQTFLTENGTLSQSGREIRDVTPAGNLSVADILARSSNIGAVKIYHTLGKERLVHALQAFHFGERPALPLPAVAGSALRADLSDELAETISFGHGLFASPLQIAAAFAAVANQGVYHRPMLVRRALAEDGAVLWQSKPTSEQVISPPTARTLLGMLEGVVQRDDGTGTNARVTGYRVAGKTGSGNHSGLFVGAVPAESPRLVVLVVVDGPQGMPNVYGNAVAAPAFRHIAEKLVPHLPKAE